ncbi:alanyl-tRNA editing protein [Siculibacillus lacustris]|uniref:Alanine--tRNA ligase n=1 Tax=Siculibacillus lacustris TaxID=1549641 RepID=A0A4Q9VHB8_9HYPH|nr:alanyl-tRNA editing protein [Siculibacillus lacustris]TBW33630.1 alanyl-tRNA editing protein [Siculibacillus lacustris]
MTVAATLPAFRDEPYRTSIEATVIGIGERGGLILDRTIFYPTGGGQPGDRGVLTAADGAATGIATTVWEDAEKTVIAHVAIEDMAVPAIGTPVRLDLDWPRRHRLMRMHTALHLLSVVLPYPVTGGSIGEDEGRLDFDIPEADFDRDALNARLAELVAANHPVSTEWITDAELDAAPELVKTMSVAPPRGSGRIRLLRIGTPEASIDLQPCGGTHVAATGEIGRVEIVKIEKKGKINRRVRIRFVD